MHRLVLPSEYYGLRADFRVDVQAGAFAAFLLQRNTVDDVRSLFRLYRPPTPERPRIPIHALCHQTLGADLLELESQWKAALHAKYRAQHFTINR